MFLGSFQSFGSIFIDRFHSVLLPCASSTMQLSRQPHASISCVSAPLRISSVSIGRKINFSSVSRSRRAGLLREGPADFLLFS